MIPQIGAIVVALIVDENDTCIYVTLPEYNNVKGVIYTRELKKEKTKKKAARSETNQHKKALSDMKHADYVVCAVANSTTKELAEVESDEVKSDDSGLIELTLAIKGFEKSSYPLIINRHRNIERILKIVKYISDEFKDKINLNFEDLIKPLQETIIEPIIDTDIDETINIDSITGNLSKCYENYLRDIGSFLKLLKIDDENIINIIPKLKNMIKETDASVIQDFDIFIWKSSPDAVFIMRELFSHIKKLYPMVDLKYIGAPSYQLIIQKIDNQIIDTTLQNIKDSIKVFLETKSIGYDIKFDLDKKQVKNGDISIGFPYKIEL